MRRKKICFHLGKYLENLENMIPVASLVLLCQNPPVPFGKWEDFDVAVISSAFEGMPESKRKMFLSDYWEPSPFFPDLNGFTPEEITDFGNPRVREILEKGECLKDTGVFYKVRRELTAKKMRKILE